MQISGNSQAVQKTSEQATVLPGETGARETSSAGAVFDRILDTMINVRRLDSGAHQVSAAPKVRSDGANRAAPATSDCAPGVETTASGTDPAPSQATVDEKHPASSRRAQTVAGDGRNVSAAGKNLHGRNRNESLQEVSPQMANAKAHDETSDPEAEAAKVSDAQSVSSPSLNEISLTSSLFRNAGTVSVAVVASDGAEIPPMPDGQIRENRTAADMTPQIELTVRYHPDNGLQDEVKTPVSDRSDIRSKSELSEETAAQSSAVPETAAPDGYEEVGASSGWNDVSEEYQADRTTDAGNRSEVGAPEAEKEPRKNATEVKRSPDFAFATHSGSTADRDIDTDAAKAGGSRQPEDGTAKAERPDEVALSAGKSESGSEKVGHGGGTERDLRVETDEVAEDVSRTEPNHARPHANAASADRPAHANEEPDRQRSKEASAVSAASFQTARPGGSAPDSENGFARADADDTGMFLRRDGKAETGTRSAEGYTQVFSRGSETAMSADIPEHAGDTVVSSQSAVASGVGQNAAAADERSASGNGSFGDLSLREPASGAYEGSGVTLEMAGAASAYLNDEVSGNAAASARVPSAPEPARQSAKPAAAEAAPSGAEIRTGSRNLARELSAADAASGDGAFRSGADIGSASGDSALRPGAGVSPLAQLRSVLAQTESVADISIRSDAWTSAAVPASIAAFDNTGFKMSDGGELMNLLRASRGMNSQVIVNSQEQTADEINQLAGHDVLNLRPLERSFSASGAVALRMTENAAPGIAFAQTLHNLALSRLETAGQALRDEIGEPTVEMSGGYSSTDLSSANFVHQIERASAGQFTMETSDSSFQIEGVSHVHGPAETVSGERGEDPALPDELQKSMRLSRDYEENARQVAEKINIMLSRNLREAELNLDPTGLGKIKITVNMSEEGIARVNMVVQQGETRELISDSMSRLRSMLDQQGISLGESSVQQQDSWGDRSQNRGSSATNTAASDKMGAEEAGAGTEEHVASVPSSASDGEVDYYA